MVGARPFDLVTGNGWGFVSVFAAGNAINVIFGCKLNVFISVYQLIFIFIYGRPLLATRFLREFDKLQKMIKPDTRSVHVRHFRLVLPSNLIKYGARIYGLIVNHLQV